MARRDVGIVPLPVACVNRIGGRCRKTGSPWGWSGDAARRLIRAGAECPSIAQLERMRMLSHRRTSLMVMEYLKQNSTIPLPLLPTEATTVEEAQLAAASRLVDSTSNRHGRAAGAE